MSYHEKKIIVNVASSLLIFAIYYSWVFTSYANATMTQPEELQFWGKTIVILIPISIAAKILIHILFTVTNSIVTREEYPKIEDERDRLIELKSTRNAFAIFGLGFVVAMALIAFGWPLKTMFSVFICFGILSELFDNFSQLYFHRSGI